MREGFFWTRCRTMHSDSKLSALFLIHSLAPAGSGGEKAWNEGSFLASTRIQLAPALKAAQSLGLKPEITNLRSENTSSLAKIGGQKCCIIGKLSHPKPKFAERIAMANLAAISILKQKRIPILTTYCDNLASGTSPSISSLYQSLLWHSDAIIYPNKAMMNYGRQWHNPENPPKEIIIEDPWQVERQPFTRLHEGETCRIIWFGHSSNSQYLLDELSDILQGCSAWTSFELTILSDPQTAQRVANAIKPMKCNKQWSLRYKKWASNNQPQQLSDELKRAHISLLPSNPNDSRKSAASHNRAVDSLQAGCITIASPLPSYLEIKKMLIATSCFSSAINSAIQQRDRLSAKWERLRESELGRFSPIENQRKWNSAFLSLLESQKRAKSKELPSKY